MNFKKTRKFGWVYFIAVLALFAFVPPTTGIRIFMAGDSTMAIKDKRTFPETGWGMPFVYFWDSTIAVENKAKNGRSTRTFIEEGLWKSIVDNMQAGDYVFVQFGHNDEVATKKSYTTPEEFKNNLRKYIQETRERKGIPVLFTPVSRRNFDSTGTQIETHPVYSNYVREIAKEQSVVLIDLDEKSRAMYQQYGKETTKLFFVQLKPGEHPNYPEGKEDNTHFSELGARLVAQLVLQEIKEKLPELYAHTVGYGKK